MICFLDDILIHSKSIREHEEHLRTVLGLLRKNQLYAKPRKTEFFKKQVTYLGHVITPEGIKPDEDKLSAIKDWPIPTGVKEVRSFLGLGNFYRKFCKNFAKVVAPLTDLLKKDTPFKWSDACQKAFEKIKELLTNPPVLRIADPTKDFRVQTDSSGFGIGAVLLQEHQGKWLPVAYISHKMNQAECSYPVMEQEFLALVYALKKWRHYLHGTEIHAYTDHQSLTFWQRFRDLTGRKARWVAQLDELGVHVHYQPGRTNIVADAFSRRPDHSINAIMSVVADEIFLNDVREGYKQDPLFKKLVEYFSDPSKSPESDIASVIDWYKWDQQKRLLYLIRNTDTPRLCVPRVEELLHGLMHDAHVSKLQGHLGFAKMYAKMCRLFYCPKLARKIKRFVRTCDSCQRNKSLNRPSSGMLMPLQIPERPWESVSFDLITMLPKSQGFDAIFVIVDRLTKMSHFIPTSTDCSAVDLARLFFNNVFKLHGLPKEFVSDRDPRFTSRFWKALYKLLDVRLALSTSRHPQTDGQTERMNAVLEVMLRHFVNARLNNWSSLLSHLEFAFNSSVQKSTGHTPFFLNYGHEVREPLSLLNPQEGSSSVEAVDEFAERMKSLRKLTQDALLEAQTLQAKFANRKRRIREFQEGDLVLVSTKNINTHFRAKNGHKLQPVYMGPFPIIKKVSRVAYKLDLPPSVRLFPVFNVSQLREYEGEMSETPPTVALSDNTPGLSSKTSSSAGRERANGSIWFAGWAFLIMKLRGSPEAT